VILFLVFALLVVLLDRLTKWMVIAWLPLGRDIHIVGDWVMLTHIKNTGAAFGLFPGSVLALVFVSLAASLIVVILAVRARRSPRRLAPLALILGGAIGNLIDRIGQGRVTDFLSVGFPDGPRWPVFNVADSAVTIGVAILAFGVYFKDRTLPTSPGESGTRSEAEAIDTKSNALPGEPT
jgi:signal peptidase II